MTRSDICNSQPESYDGSIYSQPESKEEIITHIQDCKKYNDFLAFDNSDNSGSDNIRKNSITVKRPCRIKSCEPLIKSTNNDSRRIKSASKVIRPTSQNGIYEPSSLDCKKAQWLAWNDPVFTRQKSEDHRFCKRVANNVKEDKKSTVASFKRSLRLLGLNSVEFNVKDDVEDKKRNEIPISRGRATPTFSTQLKQRSVSLTNLRNAVQESGLPVFEAIEKVHRDTLSRAVYEEWYFRKLAEEKLKKEHEEYTKKEKEELDWIKFQRQRKSEENFEKWKKMKDLQLKKQKENTSTKKMHKSPYFEVKPNIDDAFQTWKARKDDEWKAKNNLKKKLEEEKQQKETEREKKESAQVAFRAWKQQVDEELRQKQKELEIQRKKEEDKKQKEREEKELSASTCYVTWKNKKDQEMRQKLKKARLDAKKNAETKGMREAERSYEATQAFEEWLDQVEEREKERVTKKRQKYLPPWNPGGSNAKS